MSSLRSVAPVEVRALRDTMGQFATGIAVITTVGPVGFTCQSLTSLSLDPPLISFAISRDSATWPRIEAAGTVCVNILEAGQEGVARRFATPHIDRFEQTAWAPSRFGTPRLTGAAAWIEATITDVHPGGDHHIVVCRVTAVENAEPVKQPLIYHQGGFAQLVHPPLSS